MIAKVVVLFVVFILIRAMCAKPEPEDLETPTYVRKGMSMVFIPTDDGYVAHMVKVGEEEKS